MHQKHLCLCGDCHRHDALHEDERQVVAKFHIAALRAQDESQLRAKRGARIVRSSS